MAAANQPIWVQVAEAGFGARLEELGWKPVSPAHWRLDGDGVIWRTLLGRASKDILEEKVCEDARPNWPEEGALDRLMASCFADETGFELAGLDDLIKRFDPDDRHRWLNPMIRKNVRAASDIFDRRGAFYDLSRQRIRKWKEENPPRKASLMGAYPVSERAGNLVRFLAAVGTLVRCGAGIPHDKESISSRKASSEGWWDTAELGVEEVSARLTRHWEACMKPTVDAWMTAQDSLSWHMFTHEDLDKMASSLLDVYAHYIAGDLDYCRRRLRAEVDRKVSPRTEELRRLKEDRFFRRLFPDSG